MGLWKWDRITNTGINTAGLVAVLNVALTDLTRALIGVGPSWKLLPDLVTDPIVKGARVWKAANSAATSITSLKGEAGQDIIVWATNGNTTLVHSAALSLKGAANIVLAVDETRTLATIDGVNWRET